MQTKNINISNLTKKKSDEKPNVNSCDQIFIIVCAIVATYYNIYKHCYQFLACEFILSSNLRACLNGLTPCETKRVSFLFVKLN